MKNIITEKEEAKWFLLLTIQSYTLKILPPTLSKVARYKNSIQKSVTFLCISNKLSKSGIKKTIPFTITIPTRILRYKFKQR
jgi:hypothetical protein